MEKLTWKDLTVLTVPEIAGASELMHDYIEHADLSAPDARIILWNLMDATLMEQSISLEYCMKYMIISEHATLDDFASDLEPGKSSLNMILRARKNMAEKQEEYHKEFVEKESYKRMLATHLMTGVTPGFQKSEEEEK